MRCLSLADALKVKGAECHFISREHTGHLLEVIGQRGFGLTALPAGLPPPPNTFVPSDRAEGPVHASWLGCNWQADAQQTRTTLATLQPDWLVVDHYALDQRWETALQPHYQKLLVIDDLADRIHRCDLLLDQNLGREPQDYVCLIPAQCKVLTGPQYALLRPEFAALRPYSLQRRKLPTQKHLLITMGGVDQPNATGLTLEALRACSLSQDCRISVVMGLHAPWLPQVQEQARDLPWSTEVVVNIGDMAQRMADSDLAIGAAGSTSWERCCLGVPTMMVVLADNQWPGAKALKNVRAVSLIGDVSDIATQLPLAFRALTQDQRLMHMSTAAGGVTDGRGVDRVLNAMGILND